MRKLTEEEAEKIPSRDVGKTSLARSYLMNMNVGDIIFLEKHEWKHKKNQPTELIRQLRVRKKLDFSCRISLDGSGWIIQRLK